jgi:hypothetical protein
MEQALAELTLRGVVTKDAALSRTTRPEQLEGLLERAGFVDPNAPVQQAAQAPLGAGLRLAEG